MHEVEPAKAAAAQRWHNGCLFDPVRNGFIIPVVADMIKASGARAVLDVGAGTGHVANEVAKLVPRTRWTLLDLDESRLDIARANCGEERFQFIADDVFNWPSSIGNFDAALITFTLLEVADVGRLATLVRSHCSGVCQLIIVMPDVLHDVIEAAAHGDLNLEDFLLGPVSIRKIDKFTEEAYPFTAIRLETIVSEVLTSGFALKSIRHSDEHSDGVYIFDFFVPHLP